MYKPRKLGSRIGNFGKTSSRAFVFGDGIGSNEDGEKIFHIFKSRILLFGYRAFCY